MVWVAAVILILVYVGIWLAISRINTRPRPYLPPPKSPSLSPVSPSRPSETHMRMQQFDRLRMDLHTDEEFTL